MTPAPAPQDADALAIIGMAGRFPGAEDIEAYWANLSDGVDSVATTDPDESPRGHLDGHDLFDAEFFGFSPLDAERTDPQHRLFLECATTALDNAGYGHPARRPVTGIYGGSSLSTYLLDVVNSPRHRDVLDESQLLIGCDKDYLVTRVAHRLDLRGPAVVVQSACSTSLVAVHLAGQSLLAGECDMALAGGVSVRTRSRGVSPQSTRTDGMTAPDGRCRAFDAAATGMVAGDGVGVVVLRRLEDALEDGDLIVAVVRGSAINNDGTLKAGYTAPSVSGQAAVIRAAHAVAGTDPATIGFVEAHGTGTKLGDPIEVAALTDAIGDGQPCVLGSVKTNIGHLDAAAGVASLIKTVLTLRHGVIPPTLHFRRPNSELRLESTRFRITAEPARWPDGVRRAAVSSFGIGGTNAHVVLEEAPSPATADKHRTWQLVPVSARTPAALAEAASRTAAALEPLAGAEFADAAYTVQCGRQEFAHRMVVVARDGADAARLLREAKPVQAGAEGEVAFLLSGQGAQYPGMADGLREAEPVFRAEFDDCLDVAAALGIDVRAALSDAETLRRTEFTQPALFAVEYALARLWRSWGVEPVALLGHSVGELVAACLAGVLSRDDALRLVVARGRAMAACPPGEMVAVALPECELGDLPPELSIAAVNAPSQTVLSGPKGAVSAFVEHCARRGVRARTLPTSQAFHSATMDPAVAEVKCAAAGLRLGAAEIPVLSNVTGGWLTEQDATDPAYWGRQLRASVRFSAGLDALAGRGVRHLIEVGPGHVLCDLVAARGADDVLSGTTTNSLPPASSAQDDLETILRSAARLWAHGVAVDWPALHIGQRRRRTELPGYPFQRQRYTVHDDEAAEPLSALAPGTRSVAWKPVEHKGFSETEQAVAEVWERLLGVPDIGREQSFFQLGGHSLLGLQALDELSTKFGVDLPAASLYDNPTVAALAAALDHAMSAHTGRDAVAPILRIERGDAPLSPTQERFWLRQQAFPNDVAANVFLAARLRGMLHRDALRRACAELTTRHAVLRSRFAEIDGRPRQIVTAESVLPLREVDAGREAVEEIARAEAERPFALATESPVRALLVRLAPAEHVLMLTMHHIATDAASNSILLDDLATAYLAAVRGEPTGLSDPGPQFADYARWQRDRLRDGEGERLAEYWRSALDGVSGELPLPYDRPRTADGTAHSGRLVRTFAPAALRKFDELCGRTGTSGFTVLLAALQTLLFRYTAAADFLVGVPFTSRDRPELATMVGPLFTTVPIRADLGSTPDFTTLLARVKTTAAAAFDHAGIPPETFVDRASRGTAYDVLFAFQDGPRRQVEVPGLLVERVELGSGTAQCALTFSATRSAEGGIELVVDYDRARFDTETVQALIGHFGQLLRVLPGDPGVPVDRAALLTADERTAVLNEFNDTAILFAAPTVVHELIAAQAARTPDATALVSGHEKLTYAHLWRRVYDRAGALRRDGVRRGEVVGICAPRSAELVIALLAVLAAGAAFLPLDPAHPAERRLRMLTGSGAKHLLTGDAAELPVSDVRVHPLDGASEWRPTEVLGHDLAYVMYTSGSTGGPKGVMVAHDAVCNDLLWRQRVTTLGHCDRLLHTVSFAFDPAMWQLLGPLISGATVVLADHEQAGDPARLVSLVRAEKVTIVDFVPSLLTRALDVAEPGDLASLRHVFCGGERLSLDLAERLQATTRAALHNQYGPTEATIDTTSHTVTPGDPRPEIPIGRPIANKRVYVLDDRGEPVPPRVTGELWISGKGLAYGYTGDSRQTAARFRPDPHGEPGSRMYRSGDLARFRSDGVLEFAGRVDGQVKLNGVRIEPAEIEDALRRHPTVTEAVVVARAVEGQTALAAYVASAKGSIVDTHALRLFLTRLLPPAFLPTHFVVVERIPLGVTGKVDVSRLPQVEAGTGRSATPGSAEAQLAALWAEVLGRESVPVDIDFFQLGGDSQLAMRVIVAIRERFGTALSLAEFFEAPTVERLAARSDTATAEPAAPPLTRRTGNRAPLSYAQERVAVMAEAGARPADLQLELNGRLRGELDLDVLADALDALVVRHDALRVRVEDSEQFVVGPYPVLGGAPLSLADGRLLAAEVTTLGANEHQLTLRAHRIAVDGATTRVLANDLAATYCALRDGASNPLPPLTLGYPDFAVWERGWLTADVVAAAVEDWRVAATGFEPLPKFGGGSHVARTTLLATSTARALAEYGRQHDASLRTVLLTAFTGAAQRVLGTLPVCVPVNGRTEPALAGVVGRFVNLAVLLPGLLTGEFSGRLAHLRAATVEGYQRQRFLPFTALEDAVGGPGRDRLRGPVFPLMFDLADRTDELAVGTGIRLVAEPSRTHWTDFSLALQAHHIEDRLELVMLHDPDIHDMAGALHEDLLTQLSALARQELDR